MIKFEKKNNHLSSLGVGKKAIISKWLDEMNIKNYIINDDYTIDVNDVVNFYENIGNCELPEYIQFNIVRGDFFINDQGLINLKGCPKIVERTFFCSKNNLESLEGCPKHIGANFYMTRNKNKKFTEDDIRKVCNVGKNIFLS